MSLLLLVRTDQHTHRGQMPASKEEDLHCVKHFGVGLNLQR